MSSRSSGQEGSTTSSGRESSLGSRPAPPRPPPRPLDAARQQRPLAVAVTVRQQFSQLLADHFDAAEALGDSIGGGMIDAHPAPRSGKASKGCDRRYRGVTRHKRTQRFESHIWEMKKQIYLGGFDTEPLAAKAHDVMALRCKDLTPGEAAGVLNFPRADYALLLPLMEKLTREDVITCLRNYSKGQTSKRMGAALPAPKPRPSGPPATNAGVRKPSAGQAAAARRVHVVSLTALPGVGQLRPLAVRLVGAPRRKPTTAVADDSHSPPSSASPRTNSTGKSGFGGKVAPGGRAPPGAATAAAAAAAAAQPASPLKQRLASSLPPRSPPSPPLSMEPLTPHGGQCDVPAPSSPTAAASVPAAGGRASLLGSTARPLGVLRWQSSISSMGSAAAIGTYLGPATAGSSAAASSGQVLSASAGDCHLQYLSGLYSRYSPQPRPASPHGAPAHRASAAVPGYAAWFCPARAERAATAAAADSEDAGSAGAGLAGRPSPFGDLMQVDVEVATPSPDRLPEEPSLTFSASDDAYLFAPAATQGALEHVNGTVLFSSEGSAGSAGRGVAACAGGAVLHRSCSLLSDWAEPAVQPWAPDQGQPGQRQQEEAQAMLAATLACAQRPASPGRQVAVVPVDSVPAPPHCSASAQLEPAQSAASPEATAAMLCQQLQLAVAQCPASLCPEPASSPFVFFSAGSSSTAPASFPASACLL